MQLRAPLYNGSLPPASCLLQAVYDVGATVKLLNDYGDLCRQRGVSPRKIVLTFAPCGKKKTMKFIKWLGISVPKDVEDRLFASLPEGETETKGDSLKQACKVCHTTTHLCGAVIP